ncbi:MAG: hypothetical protein EGQ91_06780 [Clostridiales bacterium]|nr:hypothetical protein [Clostridiales bacterium]
MIPSERKELLAAGKKYAELSKEIIKKWRAKLPETMRGEWCNTPEMKTLQKEEAMRYGEISEKYKEVELAEYKILRYLSECKEQGCTATLKAFSWKCDFFEIPKEYWDEIIEFYIENNYVSGIKVVTDKNERNFLEAGKVTITNAGLEFLNNNLFMINVEKRVNDSFYELLKSKMQE